MAKKISAEEERNEELRPTVAEVSCKHCGKKDCHGCPFCGLQDYDYDMLVDSFIEVCESSGRKFNEI